MTIALHLYSKPSTLQKIMAALNVICVVKNGGMWPISGRIKMAVKPTCVNGVLSFPFAMETGH